MQLSRSSMGKEKGKDRRSHADVTPRRKTGEQNQHAKFVKLGPSERHREINKIGKAKERTCMMDIHTHAVADLESVNGTDHRDSSGGQTTGLRHSRPFSDASGDDKLCVHLALREQTLVLGT